MDKSAMRAGTTMRSYHWTQLTRDTLGMSRVSAGQPPDPQAWKRVIGSKPVSARLEILPETRLRPAALLTGTLFQSALAAFLVIIPLIFPDRLETAMSYQVIPVATPETQVLLPTSRRTAPRAESQPAPPPPLEQPELRRLTRQVVFAAMTARRSAPAGVQSQEAPRMDQTFGALMLEALREPLRPREPVKTGVMTAGSAVPATVPGPLETARIQTGEFGDSRGVPGEFNPASRPNVVRLGSLDIPAGPGSGNGAGAASNIEGMVASSGFGKAMAIPPTAANLSRDEVRPGGFATATISPESARPKQNVEAAPAVEPVVILEKPNPVYSEEARRLGLEGEVQVQAVFLASGSVRLVRVSKGLGYGLDEAAMRAVLRIRFKPARQEGKAVDFPATVHIMFQLAF